MSRLLNSGRLSFYLRRPDGTEKRVAGDEDDPINIAQGFGFGTTIPGGFANAGCNFTRDPRVDYGDLSVYDEFIAKGPGEEIAYQGYDIELPGSDTDQTSLSATGWAAILKDNPTFQEIYVDRDISRWTPPSASRMIGLLAGGVWSPTDPSTTTDSTTGLPAILMAFSGAWVSPYLPIVEAWYDAGPSARVSKVFGSYKSSGAVGANFNFTFIFGVTNTDDGGGFLPSADFFTAATEADVSFTPSAAERFACMQWYYGLTPAGADGAEFPLLMRNVVVLGSSSVPIQGGTYATAGVLASDVVADIINRCGQPLTYTTGVEGSIQPSSFVIPHLIYPEAVTGEEAILQASKYEIPDWGVYDDREFFWRTPSKGGTLWIARQGEPGNSLKDAGSQAEDAYNGVIVQFTDPANKTYLVGPPGTPGCDYFDASLRDESATNVLNEHGRVRYGKLVVGPMTTLAGGVKLGQRWLEEQLAVSDRGAAVVTGFIQDSTGTWEPVWKVRAGDRIRFDDADGRERRIIETNYQHEDRTNSLTLDSTPHRLDAIMEQMQVELVAIGAGS